MLFCGVFAVAWLLGEAIVVAVLLAEPLRSLPPVIFLWSIGWTLGGYLPCSSVVWQLFGKEVIQMDGATLQYRIEALGLSRSRRYAAAAITDLQVTEPVRPAWIRWPLAPPPLFGAGWGSVAFCYGGTTVRLGQSLEKAESRQLVTAIAARLPKDLGDFKRMYGP